MDSLCPHIQWDTKPPMEACHVTHQWDLKPIDFVCGMECSAADVGGGGVHCFGEESESGGTRAKECHSVFGGLTLGAACESWR
ncbi:hypothetical protein CEXT_340601 [Caerostris extrusa]|uniref:Uncharacterized protein n=1 Tax=Caerostris extrusa TaxID=172846 RepID=A0AAV4MYD1_CAEEX|nr:hypothetical protein CEXT_340601 [Caerostris extrusa]